MSSQNRPVCFVISPIGRDGTEVQSRFKEVLEFVIKPAVVSSGYEMSVIRADDMNRPGSFIKDILQQLLDSYVVQMSFMNWASATRLARERFSSLRRRTIFRRISVSTGPSYTTHPHEVRQPSSSRCRSI